MVRPCVVDTVQQELRDTREVSARSQVGEEELPECVGPISRSSDTAIRTGLCVHRSGDWGSKHLDCAGRFFSVHRSALNSCAAVRDPKGPSVFQEGERKPNLDKSGLCDDLRRGHIDTLPCARHQRGRHLADSCPEGRQLHANLLLRSCHRRLHASIGITVLEEATTCAVPWALRSVPAQRNLTDNCVRAARCRANLGGSGKPRDPLPVPFRGGRHGNGVRARCVPFGWEECLRSAAETQRHTLRLYSPFAKRGKGGACTTPQKRNTRNGCHTTTTTTDNRQQTTDNRQQTTDNRQQTTDNRQQTTDNNKQQQTTNNNKQQQPTTTNNNQQQPTTTNNNQQQPTTTNHNQPQPTTTNHNQPQPTTTNHNQPAQDFSILPRQFRGAWACVIATSLKTYIPSQGVRQRLCSDPEWYFWRNSGRSRWHRC